MDADSSNPQISSASNMTATHMREATKEDTAGAALHGGNASSHWHCVAGAPLGSLVPAILNVPDADVDEGRARACIAVGAGSSLELVSSSGQRLDKHRSVFCQQLSSQQRSTSTATKKLGSSGLSMKEQAKCHALATCLTSLVWACRLPVLPDALQALTMPVCVCPDTIPACSYRRLPGCPQNT